MLWERTTDQRACRRQAELPAAASAIGLVCACGRVGQWRADSGIADSGLELIPINFFLYNAGGQIAVDELVYQAIRHPHSVRFDRLGLFAFHLNRVGSPPFRGPPRPAMWANEFVRQRLWQADTWVAGELEDGPLDLFIDSTMDAQKNVRIKARNNYRHLFQLCGYWPTNLAQINSGADDWAEQGSFCLGIGSYSKTVLRQKWS